MDNISNDFLNKYVIVRSSYAGVFAGYLEKRSGGEVALRDVTRIWYWDGAATLSQLATHGTKKPELCKFPPRVEKEIVTGVSEILLATEKAKKSIQEVPVWSA